MKKLTVWIARDADGRLFLHFAEPFRCDMSTKSWKSSSYSDVTGTAIDEALSGLLFEHGPMKRSL